LSEQKPAPEWIELVEPATWTAPVIVSSPHSGSHIPPDLLEASALTVSQLHRSQDTHVDELFSDCVALGAPLLKCLVSRAYVDLNRDPAEFDQRLFTEPLPEDLKSNSVRAIAGLGVIPRIVSEGELIYARPLTLSEALQRMQQVYQPFHAMLSALTDTAVATFGLSCLLDCHSMPRSAIASHRSGASKSVDVVLGDRFGSSCDEHVMAFWQEKLTEAGLAVVRNHPYPGGHITSHYGKPVRNRHALQIEINRSLYMNETTLEKNRNFPVLKQTLANCTKQFFARMNDVTLQSDVTYRAAQ
jgi:N-formylglutamate deformylase